MKLALLMLLAVNVSASDLASWYGHEHQGRLMANGKPFDPHAMTCATWSHKLGSRLMVTHGNRSVRVVVTDRGPHPRYVLQGRVIDLSEAAFARLAGTRRGLIKVTVRREK